MSIDIKELLDEEEFDPKKLFNEEEYSTLLINREGFNKKQNNHADLVESLLDKELTRAQREEIFVALKEANAGPLLINSIKSAGMLDEKIALTAACWETGLDFTNDYLFFVELACSTDFQLCMEALTVVEDCGQVDENTLAKALLIAEATEPKYPELAEDLIEDIKRRIH